jgi:hypothetical protein
MAQRIRLAAAAALVAGATIAVPAQQQDNSTPNRRLEGDWVRVDLAGSGSFGGLTSKFTPAELLPEAAARGGGGRGGTGRGGGAGRGAPAPAGGAPNSAGVPYIAVAMPCSNPAGRGNGALLLNPDSGGVHFIEHKDEVIFAGERGGVRHIYMDGRAHPAHWTPTPAGHSVGRYEGDTLVVETVGMTAGTVVAGGVRTPETKLVERFDVSADGRRLTITYTWDDPKIYRRPHTYQLFMDRLPAGSYALDEWCDASDPIEQQSIVPPNQLE